MLQVQNMEKTVDQKYAIHADIYMAKDWWNSDACNVNQWDIYNSIADYLYKIIRMSFIARYVYTYEELVFRERSSRSATEQKHG